MVAQLQLLMNSRIPAIWLLTSEEDRAERIISRLAAEFEFKGKWATCGIWSLTGGEAHAGGWDQPKGWSARSFHVLPASVYPENFAAPPLPSALTPSGDSIAAKMAATPNGGIQLALDWALENPTQPCVLIIRDAHVFLQNDYWRRVVKDAARLLRDTLTSLVCVGVTDDIPDDLRRDLAILRPGLPSLTALESNLTGTLNSLRCRLPTSHRVIVLRLFAAWVSSKQRTSSPLT
jgi:hypothetical protein